MEPVDISHVTTSQFLNETGPHRVTVTETSDHFFDSGNEGFAIKMVDEMGRQISDRVVVTEKTLWKLKQIADAALIPLEKQEKFTHQMLLEKAFVIQTERDGTYLKIIRYLPPSTDMANMKAAEPKGEDLPF